MDKERLDKFREALREAELKVENFRDVRVSISGGNTKMGAIPSVSLLPILICPSVCQHTCSRQCYAAKIANLRPNVLKAYAENTALLLRDPEMYWLEVNDAIKASRYFRFHVSGDIIGIPYFKRMVEVARNNPHCQILAFTKAFKTVNQWIKDNGKLPDNLHILFSGWTNLKPDNPYGLPETNIYDKTHAPDPSWKLCSGNCFECACSDSGCWTVKPGETIAFKKH